MLVFFSQVLGEAVDEKLTGSNPCRKLRVIFVDSPERPHATTDEVPPVLRLERLGHKRSSTEERSRT